MGGLDRALANAERSAAHRLEVEGGDPQSGAGVNEPGRNVVLTWDVLFGRSRSRARTQMPPH